MDSSAAQISIPSLLERQKRRKSLLIFIALLPVAVVPLLFIDEPKQVTNKAHECAIEVGERLPSRAEVTRKITLGGLSVLNLSCGGKRYSVTIDAKGAVVGSKTL